MVKFVTNASGAMLFQNLIQVTKSISGSVVPLAMFVSVIVTVDNKDFVAVVVDGLGIVSVVVVVVSERRSC